MTNKGSYVGKSGDQTVQLVSLVDSSGNIVSGAGKVNYYVPSGIVKTTAPRASLTADTVATLQSLLEDFDSAYANAVNDGVNYVELNPEGDIRYSYSLDPVVTGGSEAGLPLLAGETRIIDIKPSDLKLIASVNTIVHVLVGIR